MALEYLSTQEIAERLGVSRVRIQQLLRDGRIKGARRVGQSWITPWPITITPGTRGPEGLAVKYPTDFWKEMVARCSSVGEQLDAIQDAFEGQQEVMRSVPMVESSDLSGDEIQMSRFMQEHVYQLRLALNPLKAGYPEWTEFAKRVKAAQIAMSAFGR